MSPRLFSLSLTPHLLLKSSGKHGLRHFLYVGGPPVLERDLLPFSVLVSKTPGEDPSWLGLENEFVPGPINFGHVRKWMFQVEVVGVSGRRGRISINPAEV